MTIFIIKINKIKYKYKIFEKKTTKIYFSKKLIAFNLLPIYANLPSEIRQNLSNISNNSLDGWCIVHIIVFPFLAKFFIVSTIDIAINESRPLVGSSQNNIPGSLITSDANVNLLLSPPDIPLISNSGLPIVTFLHFSKLN